jgi:WD40 repeat protein
MMSGANTTMLQSQSFELSAAFSPDGMQLASGDKDGMVQPWDVMSGASTAMLQGHSS